MKLTCQFRRFLARTFRVGRFTRDKILFLKPAAQGWNNRTLVVHERVDSRFLVMPSSESTITEITEYLQLGPKKPCSAFLHKSEKNTVPVDLIIEPFSFCEAQYLDLTTLVFTTVLYSIFGRLKRRFLNLPHSKRKKKSFVQGSCNQQ